MATQKTITINGIQYDIRTGLPVTPAAPKQQKAAAKPTAPKKTTSHIHSTPEKSQTLRRSAVKKPTAKPRQDITKVVPPAGRKTPITTSPARKHRSMDVSKHAMVAKFTKPKTIAAKPAAADIKPVTHPLAEKAMRKAAKKQTAKPAATKVHKPAKEIKEEAIASALNKPQKKTKKPSLLKRHPRIFSVTTITLILAAIAAYFVYTSLPHLSVKVASLQAGIQASYPEYTPDGYSPDGPITYSEGAVAIKFSAHSGRTGYTLQQTKSSWDSSALRERIAKEHNDQFITTKERGLTIYTYGGNASWVNRGILYSLTGETNLSNDQILRIATSL